ncbi:helicase-related protein [Dactylosporangium sucinum]|uniref:Helicase n=1 Tax=Dactylosporangium sucinum TaxID=1424081 RepID=A0A917WYB4_9ACTN|nr:helicase C-terminal domain-containing protein [Dactylosporangium sucinum]GGM40136.1 helicase [Dactylosporangium sucinum]
MNRYDAGPVLAGLKDFQRATVAHIIDRYFGAEPTRRFLVADETGLGKSVVARGVIAETLQRLQDDPSVKRVDVIYVCSNQDVAPQNIGRLRVTTDETITVTSRLTLLAKYADELNAAKASVGKPINLVAFTPGTSFDQGWRTGTAEERALLYLMLEQDEWDGWRRKAALRALQGGVSSIDRFSERVERLWTALGERLHPRIHKGFRRRARKDGLLQRFDELLDDIGRRRELTDDQRETARTLIGRLRTALAAAGVDVLEPDLIILDEFQRFRELLDPEASEAAELAHHLFEYRAARVLLLSATPYKPFTFAEESSSGEEHYEDFRRVLRFLESDESWHADVAKAFQAYREALLRREPTAELREDLRTLLLRVMCRTERPALGDDDMLVERIGPASDLDVADLRGYAVMHRIANLVDAPMTIEYWKSAPYFLNFLDGYLLRNRIQAALQDRRRKEVTDLLNEAQLLDARAVERFDRIDLGNGRFRRLAADTVDRGWWRLLWLPPSLPYHALAEPFAGAAEDGITKRLLFSSWNATPTAVAGLLSYEAERSIHVAADQPVDPHRRIARLDYRMEGDRPGAMSTLALFWPHPGLAALCDPLESARRHPDAVQPLSTLANTVRGHLLRRLPEEFVSPTHTGQAEAWRAVFRWPGVDPGIDDPAGAFAAFDEDSTSTALSRHIAHAQKVINAREPVARSADDVIDDLVAIGLHGPGNIAWRALARLIRPGGAVTPKGHWHAAAILSQGLRSLFNRADAALILDAFAPHAVYWQAILQYCAAGDLQAVLDEHLHTLRSANADAGIDDVALAALATEARDAIVARPSTYQAFDPRHPDHPIKLPGRFALRYGGRGEEQVEADRKAVVRRAFNSPFWPFVVATTSAGQEGIDFHLWCSAVVHWNTPANPVDFEQREGRVHRFGGHAVRRNIASAHRADALRSSEPDVWKAAYDAARAASSGSGEFTPYWVFPGPAKIERHVLPYPLSRDEERYQRLKKDLAHYRLAFGQPRQEDLLTLLRTQEGDVDRRADVLDLRPRADE